MRERGRSSADKVTLSQTLSPRKCIFARDDGLNFVGPFPKVHALL